MARKKKNNKPVSQSKNNFFEFIKNFWLPISGFIGAVSLFIELFQKWDENAQRVIIAIGFVGLGVMLLALWWVSYRTKDNKFLYNTKISSNYLFKESHRRFAKISFATIIFSLFLALVFFGINFQIKQEIAQSKITILLLTLDGPEETYGFTNKLSEELTVATKDFEEIKIITIPDVVLLSQGGSDHAKELGKEYNADLVIWGWYRPTENPNIVIHIENISDTNYLLATNNKPLQPIAKLSDLESFTVQQKVGGELSGLVSFVSGMAWFQVGDYKTAISRFDQSLSYSDWTDLLQNSTDAYIYRGLAYAMENNLNQAIKDYNQALMAQPDYAYVYMLRGAVYNDLEDYNKAILDYDKAIALDSPDFMKPFMFSLRGLTYYNIGQYDKSVNDYSQSIVLNPNIAQSYNERGLAYYGLGENQKAIDDFTQAILLDPNDSSAYANRGNSYDNLGETELALIDYNKSIMLSPNEANVYYNRGIAYKRISECESAIKDFDVAISLDPNYLDAYSSRGACFDSLGLHEQALEDYNKTIEIDPDSAVNYYDRGITYFVLEQYDYSISDFTKAISLDPNYAKAYLLRSKVYEKIGNQVAASADMKKYQEITVQP